MSTTTGLNADGVDFVGDGITLGTVAGGTGQFWQIINITITPPAAEVRIACWRTKTAALTDLKQPLLGSTKVFHYASGFSRANMLGATVEPWGIAYDLLVAESYFTALNATKETI